MSHLRSLAVLVLLGSFVACGTDPVAGDPADTGGSDEVDAGTIDAGALDAGAPDAGALEPDAGSIDAGSDVPDAGPQEPDAGEADAGSIDAGPVRTPWGGECDAPFPGVPTGEWHHSIASPISAAAGSPNHRIRDVVLNPGEAADVRMRFTYGAIDKDLGDEPVELWLRRCPDWQKLATVTTDSDGIAYAALPTDLPKGEYSLRALVLGDGTSADGLAAIWPAGTQALVTDVDGTLTTSDWQAVSDVLFGSDAEMYADANTVMQRWAEKNYRILYLTGRPQAVNRYSREWVRAHGFPRGPVQLTDEAGQIMPTDSGVRTFKAGRLVDLIAKGIEWRAAYGNATTDIDAYADAAIPKADTWIVGTNAGASNTQRIDSYGQNLPSVNAYPDAVQP